MPLTGELSDLSLAELIEFFCNQRKTGRLKVVYSHGPGYFYLLSGSVVHARVGELRGIEAVYYALTLPNASFTFSPAFEAPEQTIHQPWASLVLEGLRRMDEGVAPRNPFAGMAEDHEAEVAEVKEEPAKLEAAPVSPAEPPPVSESKQVEAPAPAPVTPVVSKKKTAPFVPQFGGDFQQGARPWTLRAVMAGLVLIIAVIGVPWGWYARNKAARLSNESKPSVEFTEPTMAPTASTEPASETASSTETPAGTEQAAISTEAADLARRQREAHARERARLQDAAATSVASQTSPPADAGSTSTVASKTQSATMAGSKRVTVQVTYDENGRVTQASGGDPTALRIARQKRFPAGKAGSATITIPIN
jgi:Domain of unknown function (DUF4388)